MKKIYRVFVILCLAGFSFQAYAQLGETNFLIPGLTEVNRYYEAPFVETPPDIDGKPLELLWEQAEWMPFQLYTPKSADWGAIDPPLPEGAYQGHADKHIQFKMVWDTTTYYMLFKIVDDVHIYSDFHAGYSGYGTEAGTAWPYTYYIWNVNTGIQPRTGEGTGFAYDSWKMDHISMFLTWNDPARTAYNRGNPEDGIWANFFPGAYLTTRPDTAVVSANRAVKQGTQPRHQKTAAIFNVPGDATYIEYKDVAWSEIVEGKPDFSPANIDTFIINFEGNEADGTTNRRDFIMRLSTTFGNGFALTTHPEWTKLVFTGGPVSNRNVQAGSALNIFPNPNATGLLNLSRSADIAIYNMAGQEVLRSANSSQTDISGMVPGVFMVKDNEGNVRKLLRQ